MTIAIAAHHAHIRMFSFKRKPRGDLATYLQIYLNNPEWSHAVHLVPMLAWLSTKPSCRPWPDPALPSGAFEHLAWSLRSWSAFRGAGELKNKTGALRRNLPKFIRGLGTALQHTGKAGLVDFTKEDLNHLSEACDGLFPNFARSVKGNDSFVLPSKTAHLLFPSVIPAFDQEVIKATVLDRLMPPRMPGRKSYATYLELSWWILQQLREEGALADARKRTLNALREEWSVRVVGPRFPTTAALPLVDTIISEYVLIALGRKQVSVVRS